MSSGLMFILCVICYIALKEFDRSDEPHDGYEDERLDDNVKEYEH